MRLSACRPFALTFLLVVQGLSSTHAAEVTPPKVFLDKSPRIVAYQLKRLNDERLLLVPRAVDDKKYIPVFEAIVSRPAMAAGIRQEGFEALATLKETSVAAEILTAIQAIKADDTDALRLGNVLTRLLLKRPNDELKTLDGEFKALAEDGGSDWCPVGFAALVTAGSSDEARELALSDSDLTVAFLRSINKLLGKELKSEQRGFVVSQLAGASDSSVIDAAMDALSRIPAEQADTYDRLIGRVSNEEQRIAACRALLRLPVSVFQPESSQSAAESLVAFAEATPAAERTTDSFIDAMQLADRLLSRVPRETAKTLRGKLREITVRVIKIGTVEEEMRYDVPYFVVEAGTSLQILLENHDLMPHNLVITQPGALKAVALAGQAAGPKGTDGLPYVPDSVNVIVASEMISPDQSTRITLTAPTEPGEYPYVCTFPQHWYRMYGVMVVVEDLDAWNQDPVEPKNPIGSNRTFVQAWTLDDFEGAFDNGFRGRSPEIGEKIFNEASCVGCHKIRGVGGVVGPELTDTYTKWKGDHKGILQEILDPSHKIDSKYAMQTILTTEGKAMSGIVVDENDETLSLMTNPEAKEPEIILQDDIEMIKRSATSMMPKALMDQYTRDEVIELMGYLNSVANPAE